MSTLITAVCTAILIGLAAVALGAVFGRVHPLLDLFGQFLLPALVGAAALALLALLLGRYAIAIAAVATLILNLAIAWPWLQDPDSGNAKGPRFKVLLFNVFYYNPRLDLAVNMVRKADADVVVLFEIIPRLRPQLAALDSAYPYRLECWQRKRCDALIYSRFPLTDVAATLPALPNRPALASVTIDVAGRNLTLFAAHLTLPFPFRRFEVQPAQAADLAATVAAASGPRLLVGDFNAATWSATMARQREAGFQILTGAGGSWPTFLPRHMSVPIDHVLGSPELVLASRELITVYGSDHRAVLAEIAFKE